MMERLEIMWRQRSTAIWLREGDRNTAFFHNSATTRKKINTIEGIRNGNGVWVNKEEEVMEVVRDYFVKSFSGISQSDQVQEVLAGVEWKVSEDMNDRLTRPFEREEIGQAMKQMEPQKAPGIDGTPALFYQRYWGLVGNELMDAVMEVLNGGKMDREWNRTRIILIPKVKKPKQITEYRPISLSNVTYKLVSKVMVNRLKEIFPDIISQEQSAFLPERLITDNIIAGFEMMHSIKKKKEGKKGAMAINLDMSKAYERVEWSFLKGMLRKLGFDQRWIALIMECITSVSYIVSINGVDSQPFSPTRGLRQEV